MKNIHEVLLSSQYILMGMTIEKPDKRAHMHARATRKQKAAASKFPGKTSLFRLIRPINDPQISLQMSYYMHCDNVGQEI